MRSNNKLWGIIQNSEFILFCLFLFESHRNIETEILEMKTEMKRNDTASEQDAMVGPYKKKY